MSIPSSSASVVTTASSSPLDRAVARARAAAGACSRRGRRRRARRARGSPLRVELVGGELRDELDALARLHEADRARALAHELGDELGGLGEHAAAGLQRLVLERRVPHRDLAPRARRAVLVDERDVVEARSAARRARRGWRSSRWPAGCAASCRRRRRSAAAGAGRSRRGCRTRRGRRAPRRRRRSRGSRTGRAQRAVVGQDPDVEHVGVREDEVRALADRRALLARRVAVVDRRAQLLVQPEARAARAPGPARAPSSGRGRAPGRAGRASSVSSVGSWKHSDLPDAVPVVTIVGPSQAASSAAAWCA